MKPAQVNAQTGPSVQLNFRTAEAKEFDDKVPFLSESLQQVHALFSVSQNPRLAYALQPLLRQARNRLPLAQALTVGIQRALEENETKPLVTVVYQFLVGFRPLIS